MTARVDDPAGTLDKRYERLVLDLHEKIGSPDMKQREDAWNIVMQLFNKNVDNLTLLNELAYAAFQFRWHGLAILATRAILAKNPTLPDQWNNIGASFERENMFEEAERAFRRSLEYGQEDRVSVLANLASSNNVRGTPEKAKRYAMKALKHNPNHLPAKLALGHACLELEEWEEGWKNYEVRLDPSVEGGTKRRSYHKHFLTPLWKGRKNQTVVVHGEQAIGEEIMFAGCFEELRRDCKQVILHPMPRLEGLYKRSFPWAIVHGGHEHEYEKIAWADRYRIDASLPIASLGKHYRNAASAFPRHNGYLVPDPVRVAHYAQKLAALGARKKIGLAWQGGAPSTQIEFRSMPVTNYEGVVQEDADFISLQYTKNGAEDSAQLGIHHWPQAVEGGKDHDLDELAALIANLDLVITVCQTAVHMAGALNIPCWVLVPDKPAWRYGIRGETSPWYPSVRMFRKKAETGWELVTNKVRSALNSYLTDTANSTPCFMRTLPNTAMEGTVSPVPSASSATI